MRKKVLKRLISVLLVCVIAVSTVTIQSEAHIENNHYGMNNWWGSNGYDVTNMKYYISSSALIGPYDMNLYSLAYIPALGWNMLNCRVNIAEVTSGGQPPWVAETIFVNGDFLQDPKSGGSVKLRKRNGEYVDITVSNMNLDWGSGDYMGVVIIINRNSAFWNQSTKDGIPPTDAQITARARSVWLHEVGHTLKLQHPLAASIGTQCGAPIPEHIHPTITGYYPKANMNPFLPDIEPNAGSVFVNYHDQTNLRARWGLNL